MNTFLQEIIRLFRPKNAVAPLLWLLIGYFAASGKNYNNQGFGLYLAGIALLNFFATAQNDIEDLSIDAGSGRVSALTKKFISKHQLMGIAYFFLLIALGLPLVFGEPQILSHLALYALIVTFYNTPPFQLSRRPIASIVVLGLCFGAMPVLYGVASSGRSFDSSFLVLAAGGFFITASTSLLKDYKDYQGDKKHAKHTFLVRYGAAAVKLLSIGACTLGSLLSLGFILTQDKIQLELTLVVALIAIYSISERLKLRNNKAHFAYNNQVFHKLLDINLFLGVGILACLYIY